MSYFFSASPIPLLPSLRPARAQDVTRFEARFESGADESQGTLSRRTPLQLRLLVHTNLQPH